MARETRPWPTIGYLRRLLVVYTAAGSLFVLIAFACVLFFASPSSVLGFLAGVLVVPLFRNLKSDIANLQSRLTEMFHRPAI